MSEHIERSSHTPGFVSIHHNGRSGIENKLLRELAHGPCTRRDLCEKLGLSRTALGRVLSELDRAHMVSTTVIEPSGRGRPTERIALVENTITSVGIDISRNRATVIILGPDDRIIKRLTMDYDPRQLWQDTLVDITSRAAQEIGSGLDQRWIRDIGVGVPYPFAHALVDDHINDSMISHVHEIVRSSFPHAQNIFVDNTVRMAALAEAHWGATAECKSSLYVRISDGIMAASTIHGRFMLGYRGHAGEVGHMSIPGVSLECHCGKFGCFETIATVNSMLRLSGHSHMAALVAQARHVDSSEYRIIEQAVEATALVCSQAIFFLNPEKIILSGDVPESIPYFIDRVNELILPYLIPHINDEVCISGGTVDAVGAARGAVLAARQWRFSHAH